jgi:hydroxymethylbilane synthase
MSKARPALSFGTLPTPLAKAQTQAVIDRLQDHHARLACQMTIVPSPPTSTAASSEPYFAATAAEVQYLEDQLLAKEFRFVVIRAADIVLPLREGVTYAAVPARDTPFDAFLNRQGLILDDMPDRVVIGVLNLRTKIQMKQLWPRFNFRLLQGGIDNALELFLRQCELDGLVVPAASAEHLGIQGIVSEIFYPEMMLPSSGQGILVVLRREEDHEGRKLLKIMHSEASFLEMEAEHAFMQRFASDQDLPVSVLAQVDRNRICVTGAIASLHTPANQETIEGKALHASQLGAELAEKLIMSGESVIDLLEADFPEGLPNEFELDDPDADETVDLLAEGELLEQNEAFPDEISDDLPPRI